MQIQVSGKKIDIGEALTTHVKERLTKGVSKYFDHAIHADVVFSKEAHMFRADIHVNEGTGNGVAIKGRADHNDVYAAFDAAAERIEKQLRRYKRKIRSHATKKVTDLSEKELKLLSGKKFVMTPLPEEEAGEEDAPLIIAEKPQSIARLTASEAVMQMDLADLPTLVFVNKQTGNLDVVYHRKDGNISWVSSGVKAS